MSETLKYSNETVRNNRDNIILNAALYMFSGLLLLLLIIQPFLSPDGLNKRDLIMQSAINIMKQEELQQMHAEMSCSRFTRHVFEQIGITLPATAHEQYYAKQGQKIDSPVSAGLVFFARTPAKESISHVGIYLQNDTFVHTPGIGKPVEYANLQEPYWRERLVGFKDYLLQN